MSTVAGIAAALVIVAIVRKAPLAGSALIAGLCIGVAATRI
ncbi:hypothetical protein ABZT43_12365 [Streptomyces sp. NPDC005349]